MKAILWCLLFLVAGQEGHAKAFDSKPERQRIVRMLEQEKFRALAAEAFDAMFDQAAGELESRRYFYEADRLIDEWHSMKGVLLGTVGDAGDHEPFSQWVRGWYAELEAKLGVRICELTHLRDIWVLNETLKVTFEPDASSTWCAETLQKNARDTCAKEYERHLAGTKWVKGADPYRTDVRHHGFAPVVTWWSVLVACEIGLWGTDGTLVCGTIATAAEYATERAVAPPLAARIWKKRNP